MNITRIIIASLLLLVALSGVSKAQDPTFSSSVTGTAFDFIHADDPSVFVKHGYLEKKRVEMPDKRDRGGELLALAHVFWAEYADGQVHRVAVDAAFETKEEAERQMIQYAHRIGQLPELLRKGVRRVVVHAGGEDTTAFSDSSGLIVLYAGNAARRIETNDLEETLFHEAVHATWDIYIARSHTWRAAQEADPTFVTDYARDNPDQEDLAETALFSFALVHHPDRLPPADTRDVVARVPARLALLEKIWRGEMTIRDVQDQDFVYEAEAAAKKEAAAKAEADDATEDGRIAWLLEIIASLLVALLIAKVGLIVFLVRWRRSQARG